MKRYYICTVIGAGTETDPYRPKVAEYPVSWVVVLASNPDGTPKKTWALALVDAVNHDAILADAQCVALPDATLDATFGSLNAATRNGVKRALEDVGLATNWITNSTIIREIIRFIGRDQEATFSENNFDVIG